MSHSANHRRLLKSLWLGAVGMIDWGQIERFLRMAKKTRPEMPQPAPASVDPAADPAQAKAPRKPAKPRAPKPVVTAPQPAALVAMSPVAEPAPDPVGDAAPVLRRKAFVERVQAASGGHRKKDVREISEAVLMVLGEALARGEDLHLPPLGRARVSRHLDRSAGETLVIKLRRHDADEAAKGEKTAHQALAEGDD